MAAEVCLLLMQSLTGDCVTSVNHINRSIASSVASIEEQSDTEEGVIEKTTSQALSPSQSTHSPQFGRRCEPDCEPEASPQTATPMMSSSTVSSQGGPLHSTEQATSLVTESGLQQTSRSTVDSIQTSISSSSATLTTPVTLDIPMPQRPIPAPSIQAPQFSTTVEIAALPSSSSHVGTFRQGPTSGPQLYRQRLLALQAGSSYTRLSPYEYADQWSRATRQPTYQDWQRLLTLEARATAGGQGNNRLEVVVGDSFGMWLPPEMLPRDRLWLNQSISGDTTAGILRRLSTFATTRPATIHLLAGANDLKNGVPETQIVRNLQQIIQRLKRQHPQAHIVVYSVLPTRRADIANDRVRSLNARVATLAQQNATEFRNINPRFQDPLGYLRADLTTDGLHINIQGYALWQQAILSRR